MAIFAKEKVGEKEEAVEKSPSVEDRNAEAISDVYIFILLKRFWFLRGFAAMSAKQRSSLFDML